MVAIATVKLATQTLVVPTDVRSLLDDYCIGCHGCSEPEAGLDLSALSTRDLSVALAILIDARDRVEARVMPPPGYGELHASEVSRLSAWVDATLDARRHELPQREVSARVRRLSRAQYERAVADLFGVAVPAAAEFPAEDLTHGFDTMADAMRFSAAHVEKYLAAAEHVASAVVGEGGVSAGSRWWGAADSGVTGSDENVRTVLTRLTERAWRTPVTPLELAPLLRLVASARARGASSTDALRLAVVAVLASPRFVLRLEPPDAGARARSYHLATRLSFFLWGSVPDAPLSAGAADGSLADDVHFAAEVERMLRDARASALATDFAGQWLELKSLPAMTFDRARFPPMTAELLHDMQRETELLFEVVLREGRPVRDLLLADFTFLNRRLATHYDVAGAFDDELRRVPLADRRRHGLLGHASVLALTSNPTRTSPIKRGKWILDNLLGAPPPAPPPGSAAFAADTVLDSSASLRAQMAKHRSEESCAVCHARMDALGFALERFDAVGRWRDLDGGRAVDDSGVLSDGRKVRGSAELSTLVATDGAFVRCLARKLFTFAVGRPPHAAERVWLDVEVRARAIDRVTLSELVKLVVRSPAFRGR